MDEECRGYLLHANAHDFLTHPDAARCGCVHCRLCVPMNQMAPPLVERRGAAAKENECPDSVQLA